MNHPSTYQNQNFQQISRSRRVKIWQHNRIKWLQVCETLDVKNCTVEDVKEILKADLNLETCAPKMLAFVDSKDELEMDTWLMDLERLLEVVITQLVDPTSTCGMSWIYLPPSWNSFIMQFLDLGEESENMIRDILDTVGCPKINLKQRLTHQSFTGFFNIYNFIRMVGVLLNREGGLDIESLFDSGVYQECLDEYSSLFSDNQDQSIVTESLISLAQGQSQLFKQVQKQEDIINDITARDEEFCCQDLEGGGTWTKPTEELIDFLLE